MFQLGTSNRGNSTSARIQEFRTSVKLKRNGKRAKHLHESKVYPLLSLDIIFITHCACLREKKEKNKGIRLKGQYLALLSIRVLGQPYTRALCQVETETVPKLTD